MERSETHLELERARKEIRVQNAINAFLQQSLTAGGVEELLEGALGLFPALEFLGVEDKGAAFLVEGDQRELAMIVHRNMAGPLLDLCARVPFGHCLCGRAALEKRTQFASCIDGRHDIGFSGMTPHGHYNVPILIDGEAAGVIVLYLKHGAARDSECVKFLGVTSAIVAGALKRLRAEKTIRRSEALTRTIIESAPQAIVVADDRGTIQGFNAAAERIFGCRREEMIGAGLPVLIPEALKKAHVDGFRRYLKTGEERILGVPPFESEGARKDGTVFPIRLAVNRMELSGRPSFVGMITDITEEKRLQDELIQSEKMAGLGTMVAGVAHEINTPVGIGVTAASELTERNHAFSQMVHGEGISEEDLESYLASTGRLAGLIWTNLERAAELVRGFKAVAVDQSSDEIRTFKVRECVESAMMALHHEIKQNRLAVEVTCPDGLTIRNRPGALSQIILNLVNNSRIHAFQPGEEGRISMEFSIKEEVLAFRYRDDGRGLTGEELQRVFEPFFTTRRDRGGSGLGMHIVYNLATQALGGTIACHPGAEKGACFTMRFPLEISR